MVMATSTALLVSAAVSAASAATTSYTTQKTNRKAEKAANQRAQEANDLQLRLASQATAPITTQEGNVELQSVEAKEDEAIKSRSARSRLRVDKESQGASSVGTGLSIG